MSGTQKGMKVREAEALIRANLVPQVRDNIKLNDLNGFKLAQRIGVGRFYVSKWLSGGVMPSLPAALALARTLGVTLDRLVTGDD
jgi:transcriptional regulator with XRE-family HTH domain